MTVPRFRCRVAVGAIAAALAAPVAAQDYSSSAYTVAPADPIDTLSAHLRTLAVSPRNYLALIGAGDAALQVGDPNAALGFFARAEQVDPRSGRAKAGLAAALVALERPNDALPLFAQALSLGVAEADIARDRGLAYDLRGDTKRAQADYALALKRGGDDETVRRYALSLGISGQRAEAMALLTPLLQKRDQSAWRARAFILAMTGDVAGANGIAKQVMPANLAATMGPFFTRLATLNAADRAHAVNFGTMPATGGVQLASVEIGDPFKPVGGVAASPRLNGGLAAPGSGGAYGTGLIPAGEPLGPKPVRTAEMLSKDPRRIPGRDALPAGVTPAPAFPPPAAPGFTVTPSDPPPSVEARFGDRVTRVAPVDPTKLPPEARGDATPSVIVTPAAVLPKPTAAPPPAATTPAPAPVTVALPPNTRPGAEIPRFETTAAPAPAPAPAPALVTTPKETPPPAPAPAPVETRPAPAPALIGPPVETPPQTVPAAVTPAPAPAVVTPVPLPASAVTSPAPAPAPVAAPPASRLASILEGVNPEAESAAALPTAAEIKAQRRLAQKKAEAAAAAAAAAAAEKEEKAAEAARLKANPSRLWVQVATGSNTRGLGGTWARIRDGNEAALKGKSAYSVPFKATNRLIVGPMKSPAEARALVNALAKGGVAATTWTSEAGQEVARVGAR